MQIKKKHNLFALSGLILTQSMTTVYAETPDITSMKSEIDGMNVTDIESAKLKIQKQTELLQLIKSENIKIQSENDEAERLYSENVSEVNRSNIEKITEFNKKHLSDSEAVNNITIENTKRINDYEAEVARVNEHNNKAKEDYVVKTQETTDYNKELLSEYIKAIDTMIDNSTSIIRNYETELQDAINKQNNTINTWFDNARNTIDNNERLITKYYTDATRYITYLDNLTENEKVEATRILDTNTEKLRTYNDDLKRIMVENGKAIEKFKSDSERISDENKKAIAKYEADTDHVKKENEKAIEDHKLAVERAKQDNSKIDADFDKRTKDYEAEKLEVDANNANRTRIINENNEKEARNNDKRTKYESDHRAWVTRRDAAANATGASPAEIERITRANKEKEDRNKIKKAEYDRKLEEFNRLSAAGNVNVEGPIVHEGNGMTVSGTPGSNGAGYYANYKVYDDVNITNTVGLKTGIRIANNSVLSVEAGTGSLMYTSYPIQEQFVSDGARYIMKADSVLKITNVAIMSNDKPVHMLIKPVLKPNQSRADVYFNKVNDMLRLWMYDRDITLSMEFIDENNRPVNISGGIIISDIDNSQSTSVKWSNQIYDLLPNNSGLVKRDDLYHGNLGNMNSFDSMPQGSYMSVGYGNKILVSHSNDELAIFGGQSSIQSVRKPVRPTEPIYEKLETVPNAKPNFTEPEPSEPQYERLETNIPALRTIGPAPTRDDYVDIPGEPNLTPLPKQPILQKLPTEPNFAELPNMPELLNYVHGDVNDTSTIMTQPTLNKIEPLVLDKLPQATYILDSIRIPDKPELKQYDDLELLSYPKEPELLKYDMIDTTELILDPLPEKPVLKELIPEIIVDKLEEPKVKDKVDEPKVDEPKIEKPNVEDKADEPKVDKPKVEEPKADEPKVDEPKVDKPKVDNEPKAEEPKVEESQDKPKDEPKVEESQDKQKDEPKVENKVESKVDKQSNIETSNELTKKIVTPNVTLPKTGDKDISYMYGMLLILLATFGIKIRRKSE